MTSVRDVTQILDAAQAGDVAAAEQLLPLVYQELRKLAAHNMQAIFGVAFSPDNQVLASTSGGDEAVRLWDLNTLQPLLTLPGVGTLLKSVHFTADGNVLLVGEPGKAGSFQFWRAPS